jgi:predicted transcriptional regulator
MKRPVKLYESEWKIMDIVWAREPVTAKEIARIAAESIGWNKNTTYTVVNKLVAKRALLRTEPNFTCSSLVKKQDIRKSETMKLIDKLYGGSKKAFFASFIEEGVSEEELAELKKLIDKR